MPDYTARDAGQARYMFLMNEGYDEDAIDTWPIGGWVDDGFNRFVYNDGDDVDSGKIVCTVEFDDDYNATVSFPDGTTGEVNIRAEVEEDDEDED